MNIKNITLLLLLALAADIAYAQGSGSTKKPDAEVGTLDKAWKPVEVHHYLGVRLGLGSGSGRFEPQTSKVGYSGLVNYGLSYRFDVPTQKYAGAIEIDLNYLQKGFSYETYKDSGEAYSREYKIVELPILWQPYLPLSSSNLASRFYLNLGPYIGYAIESSYRKFETTTDQTIEEGKYYYNMARDNRFEYGLVLGGGLQIAVKRLVLGVDIRYNIMLSDVLKTPTDYAQNVFSRTPIDHTSISFTASYRLFGSRDSSLK